MVDTGFELGTLIVGAPTKQSTIVQLCHRCVRGCGTCSFTGDVCLWYVDRLHCVIEFPRKRYFRWICLELARYPRGFLSCYSEHLYLTVVTDWSDWKRNRNAYTVPIHWLGNPFLKKLCYPHYPLSIRVPLSLDILLFLINFIVYDVKFYWYRKICLNFNWYGRYIYLGIGNFIIYYYVFYILIYTNYI